MKLTMMQKGDIQIIFKNLSKKEGLVLSFDDGSWDMVGAGKIKDILDLNKYKEMFHNQYEFFYRLKK